MKFVKIILLVLLAGFVGIQFFPTSLNQSDTIPRTDFMAVNDVPKQVKLIIKTSCYDCHSNNTDYPWYNKVQPVAWFLEDHVGQGKEELNFNEWEGYSSRRKNSKLKSIIRQIEDGEMHLDSYTLTHLDYTFYLNLAFLAISGYLVYLGFFKKKDVAQSMSEMAPKSELLENILKYTAFICYIWLVGGLIVKFFIQ